MPVLMTPPELIGVAHRLRELARRSSMPAIRAALNEIADRFAGNVVTADQGDNFLLVGKYDERARYYHAMAVVAASSQTRLELNRLADWYAMLAGTREQTCVDGDGVSIFRFCTTLRHAPLPCPLPTLPPDR